MSKVEITKLSYYPIPKQTGVIVNIEMMINNEPYRYAAAIDSQDAMDHFTGFLLQVIKIRLIEHSKL